MNQVKSIFIAIAMSGAAFSSAAIARKARHLTVSFTESPPPKAR